MKPKTIVTAVLLLFVGVSLASIVVKGMDSKPAPVGAAVTEPEVIASIQSTSEARKDPHYAVIYFHGGVRCPTCKAIEKQSHEAIATMFADKLDSGEMEWRLVDYDTPENAHFRNDFQLAFQSVVLVEERGDRIVRWENLSDVWTKIHEGPQEFEGYVVESTASFMAGGAP